MEKHVTHTARETQELAAAFAWRVEPGQVYALAGDLGAGKTTFTQGVLGALGAEGPFTSPTFTIVNMYSLAEDAAGYAQGIRTVYHMDAYRISDDDVESVGWQEMVGDPQAVVFVEWSEKIATHLPSSHVALSFEWRDDVREITLPF